MTYALGVDLGTTYTAAALQRGDRLEILDLGTRSAAIPSVVYLRDDGAVLTGEAAIRRGATDPGRLSREFKRRMGDTTAILLGGVPYSVDALMASMLRSVVSAATERQGAAPDRIAIAHPANWGQYKKDLLDQAVRRADLDAVELVTEPEAAAIHYAMSERLEPGAIVAVYDLGGGTFDAATLRKSADGFELIGDPEGIERLGGIDFDEAVFRHVVGALGGAVEELALDDPVALAAVSRLRDECVAAKEALSSDTEVSIPVLLPTVQTEVRLTRAEFEAMIRPALGDTLIVLQRSLRSAGVAPADVHAVLLVGGSSRIPLIAQLVGAELGRPVALDVHPKHSVALGAAALAGGLDAHCSELGSTRTTIISAAPGPTAALPAPRSTPSEPVRGAAPTAPIGHAVTEPMVVPSADDRPRAELAAAASAASVPDGARGPHDGGVGEGAAGAPTTPTVASTAPAYAHPAPQGRGRRLGLIAAGIAAAAALTVGGVLALGGGGETGDAGGPGGSSPALSTSTVASVPPATAGAPDSTAVPGSDPAPNPVADTTTAPTTTTMIPAPCVVTTAPCVELTALRVTETGAIEVTWVPHDFVPDVEDGFHAHLFWDDATAAQASTDAPDDVRVAWDAVAETVHTSQTVLVLANRPPGATGVCGTVGIAPAHTAYDPTLFHCLPLPATEG